ncbi:DEAD/DEAH box helicase [Aureimonas pseudogalii]|uniref:ATP-dependent RNA helicase DeaD n=1 Tax=Aureimonas pseudogalii TaxID=1744844 RepID=A0A7W6H590_9HYPH|nr:DEAD/DEAH box helicase [Aureimonas pseudogalii]MBB3998799.1 ATP-dependent RNA helicase DeaD [Aureimonas pseudogalii]
MPFRPTHPAISAALTEREYHEPTPVQDAVIEPNAEGRDLLVSAQTGSGKTVAYGLALVSTLLGDSDALPEAGDPLALIVAPTRELALQVQRELEWLYAKINARVVTCVGGMDPRAEQKALARGAHIVVGTPGRLRDHLERGRLRIANLKAVVLDEADEMLNLGFREDLEFILEATPASRRTLMFSATLPKSITAMTKRHQKDALRIEVTAGTSSHVDIEYRAIRVAPTEVEHAVVNLLRQSESPSALVFCNTREQVRHLHTGLLDRGFAAVALSGELGQSERNQALQSLRDGRSRVCVATDVAARGIDLPSLGLVIHAELPNDAETLQHRSGRTGRAGRKGVSVLLVPLSRRRKADRLLTEARIRPIWGAAPSAEEIRELDRQRLLDDPILTDEPSEEDLELGRELLRKRPAEEIAAAFARVYRQRLPEPEDVYDPGEPRSVKGGRDSADGKPDRRERPEGEAPRSRSNGPTVWFHLDIGRNNNADPKWLLPLLCRRGKITRDDIGAIRIFDKETKFEIAEAAAKRFAASAEGTDDDITITFADGAPPAGRPQDRPGRSRPPQHPRPAARKTDDAGPRGSFKAQGKPRRPRPAKG